MESWKIVLAVTFLAVIGGTRLMAQSQPSPAAEPDVPSPQLYGLYTWPEEYVTHAEDVKQVGIRWILLSGVLTGPSDAVDRAVLQAAKDGVHVVLMFHNGRDSLQQVPQDLEKFRQYVQACLTRYGVGGTLWSEHPEVPPMPVRFWKIWGEPNIEALMPPPGTGRIGLYSKILQIASQEIRKADPKSTIIAFNIAGGIPKSQPGLDSNYLGLIGWRRFIKEVTQTVGPEAFDAVGMHPYTQPKGPEAGGVIEGLGILAALAKEGSFAGKAIWFPEVGYPIAYSNNKQVCDERQQACFLVRLMAISGAHGVTQVDTFYVVDHIEPGDAGARRFGLFTAPGQWREQASALRVMIRLVPDPRKGATILAEEPNAVFAYRFQGASGPVLMAWNAGGGQIEREFPAEGREVVLADMLGKDIRPLAVVDGKVKVTLGEAPVYLMAARKEDIQKILGAAGGSAGPSSPSSGPAAAPPQPAAASVPVKSYAMVTDLDGSAGPVVSLKRLLGVGLNVLAPSALTAESLTGAKDGLVVLLRDSNAATGLRGPIEKYAADGHTVVADLVYYAASKNAEVKAAETPGIRVAATSGITAGLRKDDTLAQCGKGKLAVLAGPQADKDLTVLCVAQRGGEPAVVEEEIGQGRMIAYDLQTPEEPYIWDAASVYKYLFLANAIGNPVRFGELYARRPSYDEVVGLMQGLAKKYPALHLQEEGNAVDNHKIYSLSAGKLDSPGLLIISVVHGNEWENCLGLIRFARYLAEEPNQTALDLSRYRITLVPVMNPSGYEKNTRQNARKVDLNRNGDLDWEKIVGEKAADTGKYGPGAYDWKGDAPLGEPEPQTYRKICESGRFFAFLDVHGNLSGTGYNKSLSCFEVGKPDCKERAGQMRDLFNASVGGRFLLRQEREKECKPLVIESVVKEAGRGLLVASSFASRDKYGFLVELPAGVFVGDAERSGYGTLISTDLAAELCLSFVRTFAAEGKAGQP